MKEVPQRAVYTEVVHLSLINMLCGGAGGVWGGGVDQLLLLLLLIYYWHWEVMDAEAATFSFRYFNYWSSDEGFLRIWENQLISKHRVRIRLKDFPLIIFLVRLFGILCRQDCLNICIAILMVCLVNLYGYLVVREGDRGFFK